MRAIDGDELYAAFGQAADRTQITTFDIADLYDSIYGENAAVLTRDDFVGQAYWQRRREGDKFKYYCANCNACEDTESPFCRHCGYRMIFPGPRTKAPPKG